MRLLGNDLHDATDSHRKVSDLLDPDAYREERWDTNTADFDVHFYDLDDETVWGATARILTSFLAHLVAGR